jgi:hypothetical protein
MTRHDASTKKGKEAGKGEESRTRKQTQGTNKKKQHKEKGPVVEDRSGAKKKEKGKMEKTQSKKDGGSKREKPTKRKEEKNAHVQVGQA